MSIDLPAPIDLYVQIENAGDAEAARRNALRRRAVVRDEGQDL